MDELGVPFVITVDSVTSVTIRERHSKEKIRVSVEEVAEKHCFEALFL